MTDRPPISRQLAPRDRFARALVAAYPTPGNWRDALLVYRDAGAGDPALDARHQAADARDRQALAGERDYIEFAAALAAPACPARPRR